jgi:hypothetical protein
VRHAESSEANRLPIREWPDAGMVEDEEPKLERP